MNQKVLAPIDASVKIPPAVLALAAKADAMQKAQFAPAVNGDAGDPVEPVATVTVEPTPPAPVPPAPPVPPVADPTPTSPAPAVPPVTPDGKSAEVQRQLDGALGRLQQANATNRELIERVSGLERTLAALASAPKAAEPTPAPEAKLITPEEIDQWGPDFLDIVKRKAEELLEPMKRDFEARLNNVQGEVQTVRKTEQVSARERMKTYLTEHVPTWLEINTQVEFKDEWLLENDPLTGRVRMGMLQEAWEANDAKRVKNFFELFLREKAATAPPEPNPPAQPKQPAVSLGAFAAPGRAKSAAPDPGPADKTIYTAQSIAEFYKNVNKGVYASTPAEKDRIERDIFAAQAEGRIR